MHSGNAHCGGTTEGVEELNELLWDPHVAREEGQSPMRGGVESLGDIKGQDVVLFLTSLKPALCQEYRGAAVEPGMAPNCQSTAIPLRAKTAVNLCMRGGHEHSHVLLGDSIISG